MNKVQITNILNKIEKKMASPIIKFENYFINKFLNEASNEMKKSFKSISSFILMQTFNIILAVVLWKNNDVVTTAITSLLMILFIYCFLILLCRFIRITLKMNNKKGIILDFILLITIFIVGLPIGLYLIFARMIVCFIFQKYKFKFKFYNTYFIC